MSFCRIIFQPIEKVDPAAKYALRLTAKQFTPHVRVEMVRMLTFDNDENGYLQWVADNPNGFVINAPKRSGDFPDMLHRASCKSITTDLQTNYTTTTFKKICSIDRQELTDWGDRNSEDFRHCKQCNP